MAALDAVTGHSDVVGGGGPAEIDLGRAHRGGRHAGDITGWCGIRSLCPDRRIHIREDLRRREGAVVDAHFVDQPWEELAAVGVPTDAQRRRGGLDRAGRGRTAHLHAVDVEQALRAIIGGGDVGPGIGHEGGGGKDDRTAGASREGEAAGRPVLIRAGRQEVGVLFFLENGFPVREGDRGIDPGFQGHGRGESQGRTIGDQDMVVHAVEGHGGPEFSRDIPGRAVGQGAGVGVPRGIAGGGAAALVKRIGGDQAGGGRGGLYFANSLSAQMLLHPTPRN